MIYQSTLLNFTNEKQNILRNRWLTPEKLSSHPLQSLEELKSVKNPESKFE